MQPGRKRVPGRIAAAGQDMSSSGSGSRHVVGGINSAMKLDRAIRLRVGERAAQAKVQIARCRVNGSAGIRFTWQLPAVNDAWRGSSADPRRCGLFASEQPEAVGSESD